MKLHSIFKRTREQGYEPKTYWSSRENPNNEQGEKKERIAFEQAYISAMTGDATSILDLGPGVGRLFGAYDSDSFITTLDISELYKEKIERRAEALELNVAQFFLKEPLDRFPFADGEFDVGVAFQVFIHQPPPIFEAQFAEMCRVTRRFVIGSAISQNTVLSQKADASHVFAHDYIVTASRHGMAVNSCIVRDGVIYLEVSRPADRLDFFRGHSL